MNTYRFRVRVLASTLALLFGLGLSATAVEAWWTPPPSSSCGSSTFPATGQTTSFASSTMTKDSDSPVRDDGAVRAGGALSYQNNGDGTITDLNTGLMWEQKIGDGGLHDVSMTFPWSSMVMETIWDWLDDLNASNFAGHNDWRVPNVRELESIKDYQAFTPFAISPVFGPTQVIYWSSTTFVQTTSLAWNVGFALNVGVNTGDKTTTRAVRAVRGGL